MPGLLAIVGSLSCSRCLVLVVQRASAMLHNRVPIGQPLCNSNCVISWGQQDEMSYICICEVRFIGRFSRKVFPDSAPDLT